MSPDPTNPDLAGSTESSAPLDPFGELVPPFVGEQSLVRRATLISAGLVLIVLGIIFWLMPVMTGVPFWVAGLICLAKASERMRVIVNGGDRRLPNRVRSILRWARDKSTRRGASGGPSTSTSPQAPTAES